MTMTADRQAGTIAAQSSAPAVKATGVSHTFEGGDQKKRVLSDIDFTLKRGEFVILTGPSGAGKTTLIHHISGAMQADAGQIVFDGHDVTQLALHQRARLGLVRSYQVTSVFPDLSVQDNLALAILASEGSGFRFWHAASSEIGRAHV